MRKLPTVTAAIVFLSAVPSGQPFHLLGAPGSQLSTECLAKNVEDAEAGGYLRSIKLLGTGDATFQAPVVSMVLLPTGRRPLNGAGERLMESAELVKDRVVLMFFEQSADGEPSLDARVVERFEEAGAAGIIVLNSAAERGKASLPVYVTHDKAPGIELDDYAFVGAGRPFVWDGLDSPIRSDDFAVADAKGVFLVKQQHLEKLRAACAN